MASACCSVASGKFFEYRKRIKMKGKITLVLLVAFTGMVMLAGFTSCSKNNGGDGGSADTPERIANGQYRIGSNVKIYDDDFKPTDAYFTYTSGEITNLASGNKVILNFPSPFIDAALFFMKSNSIDNIALIRYCIDKSIEWAATAKQNNVRQLSKDIPFGEGGYDAGDGTAAYGLNQPNYRRYEPVYLWFVFYVDDVDKKGKEEAWLIMRYVTHNELQRGSQGHFFIFHEDDFARLKELFSESYLAEIDRQEASWQQSLADQDALFK
jgi:hypothetical protein